VAILSLLSSTAADLLAAAQASTRLHRLARDQAVTRRLAFRGSTRVTMEGLKRYLRPPLSVHHLSLSSLHWLPPSLLTATISRLTSLTHLNIADLRITPGHLTTLLSSLPLTHLAFTWSWSEAKVGNRWGKVAAHLARLQEVKVHLATSAEARCPLDHLTHLLALATNLTSLAVFTPTLPSNATTNTARYNVTTDFRQMELSKLHSLVLVLANRTYPELVTRQFEDLVTSATSPADLAVYWTSRGHKAPHKVPVGHLRDVDTVAKMPSLGDIRKASFASPSLLPTSSELAGVKLEGLDIKQTWVTNAGCPTFPALPWLDWSHLRELRVPVGLVVDCLDQGATSTGPTTTKGKRVSHTSTEPTFSPAKLHQIAVSAPRLRCLALIGQQTALDAALIAVPSFSYLTSLRVTSTSSTTFPTIFATCTHLEELTIKYIHHPSLQKVVASLCSGLPEAKQLRVVRVQASHVTYFLGRLVEALASCPMLEQVVVVDDFSSMDTTQPFPQAAVGGLVRALPSLSYLHFCSSSLTNLAIKQMKVVLRRESREGRRALVWGLHRPITTCHLFNLADIAHLPAACLESLTTLTTTASTRLVDYSYQELFAI